MTPLFLPISPSDLARIIREEWAGTPGATDGSERGVARLAGVDAERIGAGVIDGAILTWYTMSGGPSDMLADAEIDAADRALLSLADAIEDRGLAVDREGGGVRVRGWAAYAYRVLCEDERCMARHDHGERLRTIASLPPSDSRASSHFSSILSARLARAEAGRARAGEPGTMGKGEMMVRRMR